MRKRRSGIACASTQTRLIAFGRFSAMCSTAPSHRKVPQIGNVIIRDDVELGSQHERRPRGTRADASSAKATKIDNLVQVGPQREHWRTLSDCRARGAFPAAPSLATTSFLAARSASRAILRLANKVTVAAQSGVMHPIPDGEKWLGSPRAAGSPDEAAR